MDLIHVVYLCYILVGVVAGILGGLLGIGGGVITVPCLLCLFRLLGFPLPFEMHIAVATSLAATILNTLASVWAHQRNKHVLWGVFNRCVGGIILGSVMGALIANVLSGTILKIFFGAFLCLLAAHFYRQKPIIEGFHRLPSFLILNAFATVIGTISNLLGVGGGSLSVPLLGSFGIRDKNAIGTSVAISCVTAICGSISYVVLGWHNTSLGPVGFIDLPAFFFVGVSACVVAPLGVKLMTHLDPRKTRRLFALLLALTGLFFLL